MYYSISNKVANSIPHSYASSLDGFEVDYIVISQSNAKTIAGFPTKYPYFIRIDSTGHAMVYTPLSSSNELFYNQQCKTKLETTYDENQLSSKQIVLSVEDGKFMMSVGIYANNINYDTMEYIINLLELSAEPLRKVLERYGYYE